MSVLKFNLPLPPSKNVRTGFSSRGSVYTTKKVKDYYDYVEKVLRFEIKAHKLFIKEDKIVIDCWWFIKKKNCDVINFHDCLADAIKRGIEIDDRWFLIRDMDFEDCCGDPRVEIMMYYL